MVYCCCRWSCIFFALISRSVNTRPVEGVEVDYFFSQHFEFDGSLPIDKLNNKYYYYLCKFFFPSSFSLGRFVYTCKTKCPINIEWDIPLVMSRAHHTIECTIQLSQNEFWHIEQTWSRNWFEMNVNQPNGDKCASPMPFECKSRQRKKCQPHCVGRGSAWPDIYPFSNRIIDKMRIDTYRGKSHGKCHCFVPLCVGENCAFGIETMRRRLCIHLWVKAKNSNFFARPKWWFGFVMVARLRIEFLGFLSTCPSQPRMELNSIHNIKSFDPPYNGTILFISIQ